MKKRLGLRQQFFIGLGSCIIVGGAITPLLTLTSCSKEPKKSVFLSRSTDFKDVDMVRSEMMSDYLYRLDKPAYDYLSQGEKVNHYNAFVQYLRTTINSAKAAGKDSNTIVDLLGENSLEWHMSIIDWKYSDSFVSSITSKFRENIFSPNLSGLSQEQRRQLVDSVDTIVNTNRTLAASDGSCGGEFLYNIEQNIVDSIQQASKEAELYVAQNYLSDLISNYLVPRETFNPSEGISSDLRTLAEDDNITAHLDDFFTVNPLPMVVPQTLSSDDSAVQLTKMDTRIASPRSISTDIIPGYIMNAKIKHIVAISPVQEKIILEFSLLKNASQDPSFCTATQDYGTGEEDKQQFRIFNSQQAQESIAEYYYDAMNFVNRLDNDRITYHELRNSLPTSDVDFLEPDPEDSNVFPDGFEPIGTASPNLQVGTIIPHDILSSAITWDSSVQEEYKDVFDFDATISSANAETSNVGIKFDIRPLYREDATNLYSTNMIIDLTDLNMDVKLNTLSTGIGTLMLERDTILDCIDYTDTFTQERLDKTREYKDFLLGANIAETTLAVVATGLAVAYWAAAVWSFGATVAHAIAATACAAISWVAVALDWVTYQQTLELYNDLSDVMGTEEYSILQNFVSGHKLELIDAVDYLVVHEDKIPPEGITNTQQYIDHFLGVNDSEKIDNALQAMFNFTYEFNNTSAILSMVAAVVPGGAAMVALSMFSMAVYWIVNAFQMSAASGVAVSWAFIKQALTSGASYTGIYTQTVFSAGNMHRILEGSSWLGNLFGKVACYLQKAFVKFFKIGQATAESLKAAQNVFAWAVPVSALVTILSLGLAIARLVLSIQFTNYQKQF